jgi:hypothetical protein
MTFARLSSFGLACFLLGTVLASAAVTPLVNYDDVWRYRKGSTAPQANWKTADDSSLDASWLLGNGGFGYASNLAETSRVDTVLADMRNGYRNFYTRQTFAAPASINAGDHLLLTVDWDDGFIAWLDGVHLTNFNILNPPNEPPFNTSATADHESSLGNSSPQPARTFDLGPAASWLGPGVHVLAVMGLNDTIDSSDCILIVDWIWDRHPLPRREPLPLTRPGRPRTALMLSATRRSLWPAA